MDKEDDKNKLKKVMESLYAKKFEEGPIKPNVFKKKEYKVKEKWGIASLPPSKRAVFIERARKALTIKKILIGSLIFFITAVGIAFYVIKNGTNIISPENIDISITGPVSVNGGEEFSLEITIVNKSEVVVEAANLFMEYPEGVYSSFDLQVL